VLGPQRPINSTKRPGVTLIEVLLCVAIVAVLASLVVGALGSARQRMAQQKCLGHLRGCALSIMAYTVDARGWLPALATEDGEEAFDNAGLRLPYGVQSLYWPMAVRLETQGAPTGLSPVQLCPFGPRSKEVFDQGRREEFLGQYPAGFVQPSDYWLMGAAYYDPACYSGDPSPSPACGAHPRKLDEVRFTSLKGLLLEPVAYHLGGDPYGHAEGISIFRPTRRESLSFHVGFADGSVAPVAFPSFLPAFKRGSNEPGTPVLSTQHGVLGRDVAAR
jgi:prepilin-type N-terminal cleavage/methylation domain-containing protein